MVGQAPSSLVSGVKEFRRSVLSYLSFLSLGFVIGCTATMGLAWLLAGLVQVQTVPLSARLSALLVILAVLTCFDVLATVRGGRSLLGLRRQTPKEIQYLLHSWRVVALVWGSDIGTGVSTFRMTSAIWLAAGSILLGIIPGYVGMSYGLGLVASMGLAISLTGGGVKLRRNALKILAKRRLMQGTYLASVCGVGITVLASLAQ